MRGEVLFLFVFLIVSSLVEAAVYRGYGAWYDVNRPTYIDPDSGMSYEWGVTNGEWVLIPRPVGRTYNPLYLDPVSTFYARQPGQDPISRYRLGLKESEGRLLRSRLASGKPLKYYVVMRRPWEVES